MGVKSAGVKNDSVAPEVSVLQCVLQCIVSVLQCVLQRDVGREE